MIPWEVSVLAHAIATAAGEPDNWLDYVQGATDLYEALQVGGVTLQQEAVPMATPSRFQQWHAHETLIESIKDIVRQHYDKRPDAWAGDWNDNADEVADLIVNLLKAD